MPALRWLKFQQENRQSKQLPNSEMKDCSDKGCQRVLKRQTEGAIGVWGRGVLGGCDTT